MLALALAHPLAAPQADKPATPAQNCHVTEVIVETTLGEIVRDCVLNFGSVTCADGVSYPTITETCILKQPRLIKTTTTKETAAGAPCGTTATVTTNWVNVGTSTTELGAICPEVQAPGSCCIENGNYDGFKNGPTITLPSWDEQDCPEGQSGKIEIFTLDEGYWRTKTNYTRYKYVGSAACPSVPDWMSVLLCPSVAGPSTDEWISVKKESFYTNTCETTEEEEEEQPKSVDEGLAPAFAHIGGQGPRSELPMQWEHLLAVN
jgi:hypothetical protein